jgi:hypothetical protein
MTRGIPWLALVCPLCGKREYVFPGGSASCTNDGRHEPQEMQPEDEEASA